MVPPRSSRRPTPRGALLAVAVLGLATTTGACGHDGHSRAGADGAPGRGRAQLVVATTVAPITNIVATIAGDRAEVTGIVPEGADSHTFEPRPSVAELLATADVVYLNGLQLEEPTKELALATMPDESDLVELGELALPDEQDWIFDRSFPRADGRPNPHLWTHPLLARRYAAIVRDDLSRRDPGGATGYAARFAAFSQRVDELDAAMRAAFATIPRRELLTYHDAYAYLAAEYGWTVIDAIQVADFDEPSPAEVADLIEQVRASEVPAIFGSEVFPSPVLEQIARETDAEYVDDLRDDDLPGRPGDPEHSWLGLMLFDYITMTEALGGDATALRAVPATPVAPDRATYPQ